MANSIARIVNGKIIYLDEHAATVKPTETAARESRQNQYVKHRKDVLQKNDVDYWKAYPEKVAELSPELRRLLS